MTLEKTKKIRKINKSQLQKQKQTQNVIVNVNAPKATRKRPIKKPPQLKPAPKTHFQSPIYMPPVVTYNQPPLDTSSILSNILKIINKPKPERSNSNLNLPSKTSFLNEPNELEKAKPVEKEPVVPAPTIPSVFGVPQQSVSLADELRSDPLKTKQTFMNTPVYEVKQEQFKFENKFEAPLKSESKFIYETPLQAEPKQPSLAHKIKVGQEKKFEAQPEQPWAELEKGGHFGLLGINNEQLNKYSDVHRQYTWASLSTPTLVEEARPTSEEIDLGIVPPIAQILTEETKEKTLIPEKIETKANTEQIQLKALTMGEEKPFAKSFLHSTPLPPLKTIKFTKEQIDSMRASRVNALDTKPLLLKQEAEPILSKETNLPLSSEKEAQIKDDDPELTKLSKLTNSKLGTIITKMGGNISGPKGGKKNKQTLIYGIIQLRKSQSDLFTELLSKY